MRKSPDRGHTQTQMEKFENNHFQSVYRDYNKLLLKKDYEINDALSAQKQMEAQVEGMKARIIKAEEELNDVVENSLLKEAQHTTLYLEKDEKITDLSEKLKSIQQINDEWKQRMETQQGLHKNLIIEKETETMPRGSKSMSLLKRMMSL